MNILILGASYGSLLAMKLLLAKHNVCLVCRANTADLINNKGVFVEIKPKTQDTPMLIHSQKLAGKLTANVPTKINPSDFDFAVLAMQEAQYNDSPVQKLLCDIARQNIPCLSLMNMPPLPFLLRFEKLKNINFENCFQCFSLWQKFDHNNITLCSPDPQAFRPDKTRANFLRVGLPTNFKAAPFANEKHNEILTQLANDIDENSIYENIEVPVKLKLSNSIFTPFAKWSMLMCGNYRCILPEGIRSIYDAVHSDIKLSRTIYEDVNNLLLKIGSDESNIVAEACDKPPIIVPFEKYSNAARVLTNPSSVARSIDGGTKNIERVDLLILKIAKHFNLKFIWLEEIVETINKRLNAN